jgi:hypothetical protein
MTNKPRKITRKLGRPFKAPGAAVASSKKILSPKVQVAILEIVENNTPRVEAAAIAGLTVNILRKAMRGNPAAIAFYNNAVRELLTFAKARAAHTLIKELDGPNAAARVAAARTILEDNATAPAGGLPQVPGFAILIADARAVQPIDITPRRAQTDDGSGGIIPVAFP